MLNGFRVSTGLCIFILFLGACDESQPSEPVEEQEAAVEAAGEQAVEEPEAASQVTLTEW